jgi:hypothetical protein
MALYIYSHFKMGDALKIIQVNLDEVVKFITCVIEKRIMLYFITRRNNICRGKKKRVK